MFVIEAAFHFYRGPHIRLPIIVMVSKLPFSGVQVHDTFTLGKIRIVVDQREQRKPVIQKTEVGRQGGMNPVPRILRRRCTLVPAKRILACESFVKLVE